MEIEEDIPFVKRPKSERGWVRVAKKRLPILEWGPRYDRMSAVADLVAGVTLGLTLVPQSIAYASLANLPVQYGLYSSFIGTMLYVFLGTVKEVSIGPTSLMALFTLQVCRGLPVDFVVLLTFLSGCVVLIMGLLRLGFLVELISPSVTSGFTSATAVIIAVSQVKGLLGLSFTAESLTENIRNIIAKWDDIRHADCALGAVCCIVLLLLRQLKDVRVNPKRTTLKRVVWLLSISRNALVVLSASALAYCLHRPIEPLFRLSGHVAAGLPHVAPPPFSAARDNGTVHFVDMVRELGSAVLMLPLVMVLTNIAIAKAFCTGGRLAATQEMLTLGLCNVAGSLVHAMPTCGAFTRSAVSHSSGVRTPAAGAYSGIITLLALMFLTEYFYFIPKACLSAVLICAVIFMIDVGCVARLWRRDRAELCVVALTFVLGVAHSVELAVLGGALASLAGPLRHLMRPRHSLCLLKTSAGEAVVARVSPGVTYAGCARWEERLLSAAERAAPRPLLLDCNRALLLDLAALQVLERVIEKMAESQQKLVVYNAAAELAGRLERVAGLDAAALRASSAGAALALLAPAAPDAVPLLPTIHPN